MKSEGSKERAWQWTLIRLRFYGSFDDYNTCSATHFPSITQSSRLMHREDFVHRSESELVINTMRPEQRTDGSTLLQLIFVLTELKHVILAWTNLRNVVMLG